MGEQKADVKKSVNRLEGMLGVKNTEEMYAVLGRNTYNRYERFEVATKLWHKLDDMDLSSDPMGSAAANQLKDKLYSVAVENIQPLAGYSFVGC